MVVHAHGANLAARGDFPVLGMFCLQGKPIAALTVRACVHGAAFMHRSSRMRWGRFHFGEFGDLCGDNMPAVEKKGCMS